MHSRFDTALLPAASVPAQPHAGRLSGVAFSIVLRAALRFVAVFA